MISLGKGSIPGTASAISSELAASRHSVIRRRRKAGRAPSRPMTSAREAMLAPFDLHGRSGMDFRSFAEELSPRNARGLGEVEKAFFGTGGGGGMFSIRPALAGREEVTSPFHESWVVYACARLRSTSFSSIPALIVESDAPDAEPISSGDPVAELFAGPTDYWSRSQAMAAASIHLDVSGEDFWFLADVNGDPIVESESGLIDLPDYMVPVSGDVVGDQRDDRGNVSQWSYQTAASNVPSKWFPASSVVHFASYDPADPMRGVGPVQVALRQVSVAFQLERYLESVSRSGGPGAWLISEKPKLESERERMQIDIDEAMHDPQNSSRIKLITGDYKLIPNPANPKDLQSIEGLKWSRDVIASIMRTPLPCIGVLENSTYRNMEEAWRQFWLAIAADWRCVADVWNTHFFPRLRDSRFARYRLRPDFSKVDSLREDKTDRLKAAAEIATRGAPISLNTAARSLGVEIENNPEGDTILVPSSMATLEDVVSGATRPSPATPATPAAKPPPAKKAAAARGVAPLSREQREEYAKQFVLRILDKPERRMRRACVAWITDVEKSAKKLLRDFAAGRVKLKAARRRPVRRDVSAGDARDIERLLDLRIKTWEELLRDASREILAGVYEASLANSASELGVVSLPMTDARVQVALKDQLVQIVEGPPSTLAAQIKDAILDSMGEMSSTGSLQERIGELLPELDDHLAGVFGSKEARALTIARTEVGHAASSAKWIQYKAENVDEIQWVTSGDDTVRESHAELDGEIRRVGDAFRPHLRFPRDPEGPAGEVINCRCEFLAVVPQV